MYYMRGSVDMNLCKSLTHLEYKKQNHMFGLSVYDMTRTKICLYLDDLQFSCVYKDADLIFF